MTLTNAHNVKHSASYEKTKQILYKLALLRWLLPSTNSTAGEAAGTEVDSAEHTNSLIILFSDQSN